MKYIFYYLIFPGFLFSAVIGLLAGWIDRKVTARLQWRIGPPWHQNFTDIIKLLGKETIIPEGARFTFLFSPYLGLISAVLVTTYLGRSMISPLESFSGDLIVFFYLLAIPALALIIGASASRNPLASVGASREMKLVLAYELPFILAIVAVIIRSNGVIQLGQIIRQQLFFGSNIFSFSGFLGFLVALFCIQAKLGIGLFDIAEADQEIMCGTLIEYSGLPLAIFKLTKAIMFYTLPLFIIVLFLGRDLTPVFLIAKYLMLLGIVILIKNTNPRLRIDQALKFFWRVPTLLGVIAVILALFGL
ncbi:MAG: NADH-quinone oxidoreductase subunit H [Candidatus Omnitrophica bacterium]|nr:NADH-quinone oxidoreductase subunit H [Candidatus Omnitrophota bacterium]